MRKEDKDQHSCLTNSPYAVPSRIFFTFWKPDIAYSGKLKSLSSYVYRSVARLVPVGDFGGWEGHGGKGHRHLLMQLLGFNLMI